MEESLVIFRLLLPTNENSSKAIHPGVESFDDPTPSAAAVQAFGVLLVATGLDVRDIAPSASFSTDNVRIESLIAAKMLRTARGRTGAAKRNAIKRGAEELLIVSVRAIHRQAQRHAPAIGQHRALNTRLAPIRRVWPGFFPRPREPWWSRRPDFAISIGCHGVRRIVASSTSTTDGMRRNAPILGSSDATCCRKQTPSERLSTGSRCEGCKKCRRQLSANLLAGDRPWGKCGIWAKTTACVPTDRREYANSNSFVRRTCRNPP